MTNATFTKTKAVDVTDQIKSVALVEIDNETIEVEFWYSLISQWSTEDLKEYLCAEALWQKGFYSYAIALVTPGAQGEYNKETNLDTRNWRQNWIDGHPLPFNLIIPDVDPITGQSL